MPVHTKGQRRKARRRRRGTRSRKLVRVRKGKLLDGKINTLFEKRAKEIAEAVVKANQVRLVYRMYNFSTYNSNTNEHAGAQLLDWDGVCIPQDVIPKQDIEFLVANPGPDLPSTLMTDESNPQGNAAVGAGHGMVDVTAHGFRQSEFIKITGWSIDIRAFLARLQDGNTRRYDNAQVYWRLVSVRMADSVANPNWLPNVRQVGPFLKPWGFNSKLDIETADQSQRSIKYKLICKGSFAVRSSADHCVQVNKGHYHKFKKPLLITYADDDQRGMVKTKDSLFLLLRSQIPVSHAPDKAAVSFVTKLYYTDA